MFDYDLKQPKYSPGSQLAFLLMLCGVGLLIGTIVSAGIAKSVLNVPVEKLADALKNSENANLSRTIQFVSTFLGMALPAYVFARIMSRSAFAYIGFNNAISGKQVFIIIGILMMGLLLSGSLSSLNDMIPLSKDLEKYFRALEDEYNKEMLAIANMKSVKDYIISLIIIAMLPAIFEEMVFRGALQPVFIRLTKNAFAGILITSILFSAIHISFYGFLPRIALGLIIGYIFYFSKNLWLSSITHFLYNALGVTQLYALSRQGMLTTDAIKDDSFPLYYGLIAIAILFFLFVFFKRESNVVISMHNLDTKINTGKAG